LTDCFSVAVFINEMGVSAEVSHRGKRSRDNGPDLILPQFACLYVRICLFSARPFVPYELPTGKLKKRKRKGIDKIMPK